EEVMYLATSAHDSVSIRPVSPLMKERGVVCFYTSKDSRKYEQMKENPQVAFSDGAVGRYQAEGTVRFLGSVFADENAGLYAAYKERYAGAFEMSAPGEVMELHEFIAIDLVLIKGWIFDKANPEIPVGQGEIHFS
ncbi:MAG: pyridoxamine 5'-phosphate oxidase family protein, partial [Raoultibacter sp.]